MSRFGTQYQVARPTGVCAATESPLNPGDDYIATLSDRVEDEGFDRQDYSLSAWESGARPERLFSFWRATVPEADEQPKQMLVDDQVLLDLFERLSDDDRSHRIAFRFVLALILMRKRFLRFVGRTGEGESARWLMTPKGSPPEQPPLEVIDPHLSDDDVRELTDQLSEILQSELT